MTKRIITMPGFLQVRSALVTNLQGFCTVVFKTALKFAAVRHRRRLLGMRNSKAWEAWEAWEARWRINVCVASH